jgi:hypothetical protein
MLQAILKGNSQNFELNNNASFAGAKQILLISRYSSSSSCSRFPWFIFGNSFGRNQLQVTSRLLRHSMSVHMDAQANQLM